MEMIHATHDPRHMQVVVLDGDDFTIEEVVAVARYHAKVEFAPEFIERVNKSRAIIDRFVAEDRPVYGVTTGFGDNVTKRVTPEDAALLQLNIARSHAVSVGEPLKEEQVRAIQIAQINNSGRGVSGVSIELLEAIRDLLNHNVTPFVPGEGVVGALSTEGQTTLPLIGEGKAFYQGKLMSGAEALSAAGLKPYQLKSKEGLSLLNGTPGATGLACLATYDAMEATKASEIMAAFSYETNKGNIKHLDPRLHSVKNHSEQQESAENILNLLKGSEISQKYEGYRMQDAYSLRCVAQMMGGTKRAIKEAYISVTEELNSCSDNPVIYPTGDGDGVALMGGNFDRAYLCIHMDALCIAMTHLGKLVERRTDRLTNRHFSDYPPFLVKNPGLNSGFMITQYTSAGLVAEMKVLSHPVSVDSIPTSANQEDPVSFGFYASRKACEVAKKLEYLNAIELMTQVQAMDFMEEGELKHSPVIQAVYNLVRAKVPTVEKDRHFYPDIMDINELLVSGKVIDCAEEISGKLKF